MLNTGFFSIERSHSPSFARLHNCFNLHGRTLGLLSPRTRLTGSRSSAANWVVRVTCLVRHSDARLPCAFQVASRRTCTQIRLRKSPSKSSSHPLHHRLLIHFHPAWKASIPFFNWLVVRPRLVLLIPPRPIANPSMQEGKARDQSSSASTLVCTLVPTLLIAIAIFSAFLILRRKASRVYQPRSIDGIVPQQYGRTHFHLDVLTN